MAFFKFRKGGDDHPAPAPAPESVEAMRKRARHRLIGAAVLVLVGVIGFPLLFDNQPRPVAVDIPIVIPDKAKSKPLTVPQEVAAAASASSSSGPATLPVAVVPSSKSVAVERASEGMITESKEPERVVDKAVEKTADKATDKAKAADKPVDKKSADKVADKATGKPAAAAADHKSDAKADTKAADAKKDDGSKARALLDGKSVSDKAADKTSSAGASRYVVQVGAYADVTKAREARHKLEKAGLKTYTQVVQSPEHRIRVRVGPFESKSEADSAAAKIKKLDLPASVLEL